MSGSIAGDVDPIVSTGVRPATAAGATNIRNSSRRTADSADLNEGREVDAGWRRLGVQVSVQVLISMSASNDSKKALTTVDKIDNTDDDLIHVEFARIRSQSKPVFRRLPSFRNIQRREKLTCSSRFSGFSDIQVVPPSVYLSSTWDFL